MKTKTSRKAKQLASALLTVLFIGTILAVGAMSYLTLVEQQNLLSFRSQSWNLAITVVEAGLEDGLEQLNSNTANLSASPWTFDGQLYSHTYTYPNGNSYTVTIDMRYDVFNPVVISHASVNPASLAQHRSWSPSAFLAAIGTDPQPVTVQRAVRVRAARGNLLIKGMVAKHKIDMNGNDMLTDSFDSSDPNHSNSGMYPAGDTSKVKDNGDVATNDSITNGISSGNANIYGHVTTGPGGTVSVGPNGGVGDHAYQSQASNKGKIESGYSADNANFTFPDQILPYTSGTFPSSGDVTVTNYNSSSNTVTSATCPNPIPYGGVITNHTSFTTKTWPNAPGTTTNCNNIISSGKNFPAAGTYCGNPPPWQTGNGNNNSSSWNWYGVSGYSYTSNSYTYNLYTTNYTFTTTHYDHILYNGDYYLGSALSGNTLVLGNARLVLPNGISMSGNDTLTIAQTGCLAVWIDKNSSIAGNGVFNNNGFAENCQIYATPKVTSLSFKGNGTFTGVIVAPEAFVTMNGGGNSVEDFVGALMADSVKMNGHFQFHYDEALGKDPAKSRFIVKSWDEINPN